jgi:hypothetical protein
MASALDKRVEIRFVSLKSPSTRAYWAAIPRTASRTATTMDGTSPSKSQHQQTTPITWWYQETSTEKDLMARHPAATSMLSHNLHVRHHNSWQRVLSLFVPASPSARSSSLRAVKEFIDPDTAE